MAKIMVNEQGVTQLRSLSRKLSDCQQQINTAGKKLESDVSGLVDIDASIKSELDSIVKDICGLQIQSNKQVEELSSSIVSLANKLETIVNGKLI